MKIISFFNNKGGVLKTTSAIEISGLFSKQNKKVLLIDLDGQGNIAVTFGQNPSNLKYTIWESLVDFDNTNTINTFNNAVETKTVNLDIIYSNFNLYSSESYFIQKSKEKGDFKLIKNFLKEVNKKYNYDYVIIDSAPSVNLLLANILEATDKIIIPAEMELYSQMGILNVIKTLEEMGKAIGHKNLKDKIAFVLPTKIDKRIKEHKEIYNQLKQSLEKMNIKIIPWLKGIPAEKGVNGYSSIIRRQKTPLSLLVNKNKSIESYKTIIEYII